MSTSAGLRVRFASELAKPPADRPRRTDIVYPRLAQSKGVDDRLIFDLHWTRSCLSSVSLDTIEAVSEPPTPKPKSVGLFGSSSTIIVIGSPKGIIAVKSPEQDQDKCTNDVEAQHRNKNSLLAPTYVRSRSSWATDAKTPPLVTPTSSISSADTLDTLKSTISDAANEWTRSRSTGSEG